MLVDDWLLGDLDDGLWCWSAVAQSTMWSLRIVVFSPFLDDDLRFFECVEDFAV